MADRSKKRSPGEITEKKREKLSDSQFAFPKERKEPLTNKRHVQEALARFDQVKGVSDAERKQAFQRIKRAAKKFGLNVEEKNWHALGKRPHTKNPVHTKGK